MSNVDFSSWPPHQEAAFQVYEQVREERQRRAWLVGGICAGAFFLLVMVITLGVTPHKVDLTKDMNMSNITKKSETAPAAAPAAPPAEAPTAAPAEAPAEK